LFFILYADKTQLSSFGTEKGYPVIARIANLPVDIHNGEGIGGGQIVGWLPIVSDISVIFIICTLLIISYLVRLKKTLVRLEKQHLSTTSKLFGMNHLCSLWRP
jgi:hypothetical protein